jgi:hypothetical protein
MTHQVVEERVSRHKFNRELDEWRAQSSEHTKRGIFLLEATFPKVFAIFAAPHLSPPCVVFAVELDFTNYDVWPPSVRFLQPFSREPYLPGALPPFLRIKQPGNPSPNPADRFEAAVMFQQNEGEAFMCMQGVREYHLHPAHNGDSWLLHRGTGKGTLFHILDKLHEFGIAPLASLNMTLQIQFGGYVVGGR